MEAQMSKFRSQMNGKRAENVLMIQQHNRGHLTK